MFFFFILFGFTGCEQAINDLNKSLYEFNQKLNNRYYEANSSTQETINEEINIPYHHEQISIYASKTLSEDEFYKAFDDAYVKWANILNKYAIKNSDSLSSIEIKYKNSYKLFQEKIKDDRVWRSIRNELRDDKYSNYIHSKKFHDRYSSKDKELQKNYIIYIYGVGNFGSTISSNEYKAYLKGAYNSYNEIQASILQKIEDDKKEKELEVKLLAEQKQIQNEREKVKDSCKNWLNKSKQNIYNLGVGENVVTINNGKVGATYTINKVEKNTFLVGTYTLWNTYERFYIQKSDLIPASSLQTAPSKYCYQ